jgi:hypothetical protein
MLSEREAARLVTGTERPGGSRFAAGAVRDDTEAAGAVVRVWPGESQG